MVDDTSNMISEQQGLELFRDIEQRHRRVRSALTYNETAREIPVCVPKTSSDHDFGLASEIPCSCARIPCSSEIIPCSAA
jgi:hypothetical protein